MKPVAAAATPSGSFWRLRARPLLTFLGPLLVVVLVYGQSVYRSPAFGQLADQGYHLASLKSFDEAWRAGEFPPAWDAAANGGRGSPGFALYPPLFAFLGAVVMRAGLDSIEALRLAFLLSAIALYGGVFYLAIGFSTPLRAALGGAAACLLPGATFASLARGMYPGFLALAWIALLLGALDRLAGDDRGPGVDRNRKIATFIAIAAAVGLILTHTLSAYMTLWILLIGSPRLLRRLGRAGMRRALTAAVAALAVTAWFWIPMLMIASEAQTGYLATSHPYAHSLIGGPTSATTALERSWTMVNGLGKAVAVSQLLLAAWLCWVLRKADQPPSLSVLPAAIVLVAAASFYPTGDWLTAAPQFDNLQFAWRWQGLVAVLYGAALAALPAGRRTAPAFLTVLLILSFLPLLTPADRAWRKNDRFERTFDQEQFSDVDPATRAAHLHNRIEMRPNGADRLFHPRGAPGRWEILNGEARISAEFLAPSRRVYSIQADSPVTLRLLTYHFRSWQATVDGAPIAIGREAHSGLQLVSLPAGSSQLELKFSRTKN